MQEIIYSEDLSASLSQVLCDVKAESIMVLCDESTAKLCLPRLQSSNEKLRTAPVIIIKPGDAHKHIDTVIDVWRKMQQYGATRHSMLVNLGGGMVTDLGGFCASTFKRGMRYINIPTTLLGAVDAAVGGKTGFNFGGLKNEIGVINSSESVVIDTEFFASLDFANRASGFAEMLKHGLISNRSHWEELLAYDLDKFDLSELRGLLEKSIGVKERVVREDPYEKGIRKALNFGHTFGHAFESFSHEIGKPVLHGYAVAWGMVAELYMSYVLLGFPKDVLSEAAQYIRSVYGRLAYNCKNYDHLYELMTHDKKNVEKGIINFTLLGDIGDIRIDQHADRRMVDDALDFVNG